MPLVVRIAVITTICFLLLLIFYAILSLVSYYRKKRREHLEEERKSNSDCYTVLKEILTYDEVIPFKTLEEDFENIKDRCHKKQEDIIYEMLVV